MEKQKFLETRQENNQLKLSLEMGQVGPVNSFKW
jgi:hypothetical protein